MLFLLLWKTKLWWKQLRESFIFVSGSQFRYFMEGRQGQQELEAAGHVTSTTRQQRTMTAHRHTVPFLHVHRLGFQQGSGASHSGQVQRPISQVALDSVKLEMNSNHHAKSTLQCGGLHKAWRQKGKITGPSWRPATMRIFHRQNCFSWSLPHYTSQVHSVDGRTQWLQVWKCRTWNWQS